MRATLAKYSPSYKPSEYGFIKVRIYTDGSCAGDREYILGLSRDNNGVWTGGFEGHLLGFSVILVAVSIHVFLSSEMVARSPDHLPPSAIFGNDQPSYHQKNIRGWINDDEHIKYMR